VSAFDADWANRQDVTPELYVAVGISGASHHMAGCGNAKAIVAINSDAEAAIFKDARFGVVGDYKAIIPALAQEITRRPRLNSFWNCSLVNRIPLNPSIN
jgi:hypothetical protein